MIIVHFEVYVLENRGWMLHARYPRLDREEAMHEARELEASQGLKVRVLRETYDTENNAFEEVEVYVSGHTPPPSKKSPPSSRSKTPPPPPRRPARLPAGTRRPSHAKPAGDTLGAAVAITIRLTLILLAAVAVGLLALRLMPSLILLLYQYGFRITPQGYNEMLAGVFVVVVLAVAIPLGLRYLPGSFSVRKDVAPSPPPAPAPPPRLPAKTRKSLDKLAELAAADPLARNEADPAIPEIPETWNDPPPPEPPPEPPPPPPEPVDPTNTPAFKAALEQCERFLDGAVALTRTIAPTFDQYHRFAINLYMAGAVGAAAEARRLDEASRRRLLTLALERNGASADIAARVEERLSEYMTEPRYLRLIQAGRAGMETLALGNTGAAHEVLDGILKDWSRPATEKKASIMTVMFTDMVGSTDFTQAKGDLAGQEMVRHHNAIVRSNLARFSGKEIKHTGDGIMASFASAANAVEATIHIQREVAAHNQRMPSQPLHLRIGLNAGEPIQEEDDLFGLTVQLAARVCAATQPDRILCTTVVKDLAFGKGVSFENAGSHTLKGIRDKVPLWEVVWA